MKKSITRFIGVILILIPSFAYSFETEECSGGVFSELSLSPEKNAVLGEIGIIGFPSREKMFKVGLVGFASEDYDKGFVGGDLGIYYRTSTRLSPYAGIGVFAAYSKTTEIADNDGIDNDDDGFIDESGEENERISEVLASIYPEVGINYWFNDITRISCFSKYHFSSSGRDNDLWLVGVGISITHD